MFELVQSVYARQDSYQLDSSNVQVSFSVTHLGLAKVEGFFQEFKGNIWLNDSSNSIVKVNLIIYVRSIKTNNTLRDQSIVSSDFLDASKFPKIIFFSNPVSLIKNNDEIISGLLTIKSRSRKVDIPFNKEIVDNRTKFSGSTAILRSDFKLSFGVLDTLIGNEIKITYSVTIPVSKL